MDCMAGAAWVQLNRRAPDWLTALWARLVDVENESHECGLPNENLYETVQTAFSGSLVNIDHFGRQLMGWMAP